MANKLFNQINCNTDRYNAIVANQNSCTCSCSNESTEFDGCLDVVYTESNGTLDYEELYNKPTINGKELNGNVSWEDLDLPEPEVDMDKYIEEIPTFELEAIMSGV